MGVSRISAGVQIAALDLLPSRQRVERVRRGRMDLAGLLTTSTPKKSRTRSNKLGCVSGLRRERPIRRICRKLALCDTPAWHTTYSVFLFITAKPQFKKPQTRRNLWTIQRTPAVSDAEIADNPIPRFQSRRHLRQEHHSGCR